MKEVRDTEAQMAPKSRTPRWTGVEPTEPPNIQQLQCRAWEAAGNAPLAKGNARVGPVKDPETPETRATPLPQQGSDQELADRGSPPQGRGRWMTL